MTGAGVGAGILVCSMSREPIAAVPRRAATSAPVTRINSIRLEGTGKTSLRDFPNGQVRPCGAVAMDCAMDAGKPSGCARAARRANMASRAESSSTIGGFI
jgi:hypothetical protein